MTPRALCAVLLAALCACSQRASDSKVPVGQAVPEVTLAALEDGKPVPLSSYRGRSVVLNIWASWCEPCRKEMPSLQALAARHAPGDLAVVGVALDTDYNLAREFLLRYGIRFQNLADPGGKLTGEVLGVKALPETLLISRDGRLASRLVGPRDWASEETAGLLRKALSP